MEKIPAKKLLLVGDIHGNVDWLKNMVFTTAEKYEVELIFQLGDFGWWGSGSQFVKTAAASPVPFFWLDGNHEDHRTIKHDANSLIDCGRNLVYVPRGMRLSFNGVSTLVCGGAHSIDRRLREIGKDVFFEEDITDAQIDRCVEGGHADVLLSHDAPFGWQIPNLPSDGDISPAWAAELPACWASRERLGTIMDGTTPILVAHGHYHSAYQKVLNRAWSQVYVIGLDCDGTSTNTSMAILECIPENLRVLPVD